MDNRYRWNRRASAARLALLAGFARGSLDLARHAMHRVAGVATGGHGHGGHGRPAGLHRAHLGRFGRNESSRRHNGDGKGQQQSQDEPEESHSFLL